MCVLSIKVPIRKKSGNLFNDLRIYIYIYIYTYKQYRILSNLQWLICYKTQPNETKVETRIQKYIKMLLFILYIILNEKIVPERREYLIVCLAVFLFCLMVYQTSWVI